MEVVGIGAGTLDDLWLVPDFRDQEEVSQALDYIQMGGGPVATALCVLAVEGHTAALLDTLGNDATGAAIAQGLADCGVSLAGISEVPRARSARAVILVRQGDGARQIVYLPSDAGELSLSDPQRQLIRQSRLLHLNGRHEHAAREAVEIAKAAGVTVSFDGGAGRYRDSIRDLVLASQIRILSRDFAQHFCGSEDLSSMQNKLLDSITQILVITEGVQGSHVVLPDGTRFHQPAFPASPLVDTTGCGDVYHGAFLHGWLQRWSPQRCAEFASQKAAQNAQGLGGRCVCQKRQSSVEAELVPPPLAER